MNLSPFTSLTLKLFGVIFILAALLDFATLAFPLQLTNDQWQLTFVTGVVDRGVVPLLGMAMITLGYWIDSLNPNQKISKFDLRLPTYILAILLGLSFLLFVPIHLVNLNKAQAAAVTQIEQGAGQGRQQIEGFLRQLNTLSSNPAVLDKQIADREKVLTTGEANGNTLNQQQLIAIQQETEQLKGLRDISKDPQAFKSKVSEIQSNLETQLAERQKLAEGQARVRVIKQGLRIGLSSLMMSIGFAAFGALGLRSVLGSQKK